MAFSSDKWRKQKGHSIPKWNSAEIWLYIFINTPNNYIELRDEKYLYITVENLVTDWREWIKTLGKIPFHYEIRATDTNYAVKLPNPTHAEYLKNRFAKEKAIAKGLNTALSRIIKENQVLLADVAEVHAILEGAKISPAPTLNSGATVISSNRRIIFPSFERCG